MHTTAALVAIFAAVSVSVLIAILLPLIASQSKAEQEKARARLMAEHRMNARLLRLDI
jgi:hypothetical protein